MRETVECGEILSCVDGNQIVRVLDFRVRAVYCVFILVGECTLGVVV